MLEDSELIPVSKDSECVGHVFSSAVNIFSMYR